METIPADLIDSILNQMSEAVVAVDRDYSITSVNRAAIELFGYSAGELQGMHLFKGVFTTLAGTGFESQSGEVRDSQQPRAFRHRIPTSERPDGALHQIRIIPDGEGLLILLLPLTEQEEVEEALRESEQKYQDLFEKSEDAILIIRNRSFVDCNQATLRMLGYGNREEFLGTHPSALSPEKQPDGRYSSEKADEMMRIALESGSNRFEWDHVRASGEVFPVEVLLTTISTDEGDEVLYTVWRDITERKRAERDREQLLN